MGRILDVSILENQAKQIECDARFHATRGGNRAGKSIGYAYWLFLKRLQRYPLAVHAIAGADYDNLRRGFFPLMCGVLDSLGWEEGRDFRYVASGAPRLFLPRLHPHAKLHSISIKLAERLKGTSIQTLLLEEPQSWGTKDVSGKRFYEILITRLSHSQITKKLYPDLVPMLRMSFNPPAEGSWLYQLIEEQWKERGYECLRMSVRDNFLLLGREEYIADQEANIDPRRQPAEIDGHWRVGGGGAYYEYEPTVHGHPPEGVPPVDWVDPDQPLLWTHDFNVAMMCSLIGQRWEQPLTQILGVNPEVPREQQFTVPVPSWQRKLIRFLGEIADEDSSTPKVLKIFLASPWADIARRQGLILFGDRNGGARSQTAENADGRTNWLILKNGLEAAKIKVTMMVPKANPGVINSVNDFNAQLRTGIGPGMTINIPKCPVFVNDLRELGWKPSRTGDGQDLAKVAGKVGDASDAARYLVSVERNPPPELRIAFARNRRP